MPKILLDQNTPNLKLIQNNINNPYIEDIIILEDTSIPCPPQTDDFFNFPIGFKCKFIIFIKPL
jgi:hypothetical protein